MLRRERFIHSRRFVALTSLPNTPARNTARRALRRTKPRATASSWPRWCRPAGSAKNLPQTAKKPSKKDEHDEEPKFRSVGDELQTDETFDHDIIERMGAKFYEAVFVPAITKAREAGKTYETIRDTLRKGWKPARK